MTPAQLLFAAGIVLTLFLCLWFASKRRHMEVDWDEAWYQVMVKKKGKKRGK